MRLISLIYFSSFRLIKWIELPQQSKSEGNKHCCYGTCNSDTRYRHREEMKDVFFIPFPKPTTRRETCLKWIKACGRPGNDFNVDKIKRSTYICSKHFVGESGPTAENPDPIPALLHTDEQVSFTSPFSSTYMFFLYGKLLKL